MPLSIKHVMKIAPIGQNVSLSLNTGEQLHGVVTELGVDHLLIDDECIISIDNIAKISRMSPPPKQSTMGEDFKPKRSQPTNEAVEEVDHAVPLDNSSDSSVPNDGAMNTEGNTSTALYKDHSESVFQSDTSNTDIVTPKTPMADRTSPPVDDQPQSLEAMQKLFRVVENVRALVSTAKLESPAEPDYKKDKEHRPDLFLGKKNDWKKLWASYEYAKKIKELEPKFNRTPSLATKADLLLRGGQTDPIILSYAAHFNSLAGRFGRAEDLFKDAIAQKPCAAYWIGLAWIYIKQDKIKALIYALENLFLMTPPGSNKAVWYYYVGRLMDRSMEYYGLLRLLQKIDPIDQCLLNTLAFFMHEQGNISVALQLVKSLMGGKIKKMKLIELWRSVGGASEDDLSSFAKSFDKDLQTRTRNLNSSRSQRHFINDASHLEGKINNLFVDSSYGFITAKNGVSYYFQFSDIADIDLYYRISQKITSFQNIESLVFIPTKNIRGHKAIKVAPLVKRNLPIKFEEYSTICSTIIHNAEMGTYDFAIYEAEKLQKILPEATYISDLVDIWQNNPPRRIPTNAPKGNDSYRKALRAKLNNDYSKAKSLFFHAIYENENTDKAINELALMQSNLCEFDEALDLIKKYEAKVSDSNKLANTKVMVLIRAAKISFGKENYSKSQDYYRKALALPQVQSNNNDIVARGNLAVCLAKQGQVKEAKELLLKYINQPRGDRLKLVYESIEDVSQLKLIDLEDFTSTRLQSQFAKIYVNSATSEAYDEKRFATGEFTDKDIDRLGGNIEGVGYRKPETRAGLLLTSARVFLELGDYARSSLYAAAAFRDRARHSLDNEKNSIDIAITWYAEALLAYDRCETLLGQGTRKMLGFIYSTSNYEETIASIMLLRAGLKGAFSSKNINISSTMSDIAATLKKDRDSQGHRVKRILDALVWLNVTSSIKRSILKSIYKNIYWSEAACDYLRNGINSSVNISTEEDFIIEWDRKVNKSREEYNSLDELFYSLSDPEYSHAWLSSADDRINEIIDNLFLELDHEFINKYRTIIRSALDSCSQDSFELRENYCLKARDDCDRLLSKIKSGPTKFSIEMLSPCVTKIQEVTNNYHKRLITESVPRLSIKLDNEKCVLNQNDSTVDIYLTVTNEINRALAENVKLKVAKETGISSTQSLYNITEALRGGESNHVKFKMKLDKEIAVQSAFSFTVFVEYLRKDVEGISTDRNKNTRLVVNLTEAEDQVDVINPYEAGATGKPIESEDMFYGRNDDVSMIITSLMENKDNGKCDVLYGQKRSGKSSILYHVKNHLKEMDKNLLTVDIGNIGKYDSEHLRTDLLWAIISEFKDAVEDFAEERGIKPLDIPFPDHLHFYTSGLSVSLFNEVFGKYHRLRSKQEAWKNSWVCLFIDEFTYLYNWIIKGKIPDTFMEYWKAILQNGYFSAFLVGQDYMQKFIDLFPNEIQAMGPRRIDYLNNRYAEDLIREPIERELGRNPFRGQSIKIINKLAGGNPWYIQIICDRVVRYMIRERLSIIREADINEIIQNELLSGGNRLNKEHFDNLLNSGDQSLDVFSDEDVEKVLEQIAINSKGGDCYRSRIKAPEVDVDGILNDLEKRTVVARNHDAYSIRVELFKKYLIAQN